MERDIENMVIPQHVALILDGNGRWAKKRGLPRTVGHKQGCVTVEQTVEDAARLGIRYLTVYGFSTDVCSDLHCLLRQLHPGHG